MTTSARDSGMLSLEKAAPGVDPALERAFRRAMDGLFMVFQPIVSWKEKDIVAYEALVRTCEPELARPDLLFSAAEQLDMIIPMGRRIRRGVAQLVGNAPERVSLFVNVHGGELADPELYDAESPLSRVAERVVLEITERWSLDRFHDVGERIRALRDLGFRVAVDDLGAGYAGLTSFARLRPEIVKLDMSLIRGVNEDPTRQHLIRSLNGACRDLGIRVVAEGVETREERDTLIALGSDLLQGYLFSKPARAFPTVDSASWEAPSEVQGWPARTAQAELVELRDALNALVGRLGSETAPRSLPPAAELGALGRRALRSVEALLATNNLPSLKPGSLSLPAPTFEKLAALAKIA
ncbi:MAG TPA: EAL domain-containing protein [Polyangiaceae bacterium]|jgi:EAL domain-containing protein (putative c-di-GMP-specific phosphodiesterase class I)|nr:EAL domain-containing protein [Polyangiaceae bacterium]